ncbi:MAG: hypothetical protein F4153_00960, partial [Acidimicrobiia bacterium]|nr:hypothetical protein [Acidimicrobiia bacterium]
MAKNVFSGFRSARLRPSESSRARRRVTTWAAIGVIALLATLLTPLSTASAQPSAPSGPTITSATPSNGAVTLTWNAGDDGGSTVIRWEYTYSEAGTATNLWIPIPGSNRNTNRHTITGLDNGDVYVFDLRAINGAGNGEAASEVTGEVTANRTATPSTTPAAPTTLRGTPLNSQVTLSWDQVADNTTDTNRQNGFNVITSYEVRQKTGDGDYSPWAIIIGSDQTTQSHPVTGLTNGTTYQFQVRAVNENGKGAAAETTPVTIATTPGRPRSLTATPGNGQVTLTWTASSNGGAPITSWQFRLSEGEDEAAPGAFADATHAWVTIPGSGADTTSYTVVSLDNTSRYMFQVRAVNAIGPGTHAESAVVNPGMPPGQPTNLSGAASESSVTITWMPPLTAGAVNDGGSPILRYEYSQKTGDGEYGEWTAVPSNALFTTTTADLTGADPDRSLTTTAVDLFDGTADVNGMGTEIKSLTAGTAYQFRVRAVNATGAGRVASMSSPVYPGTKPPAPANLNARAIYDATAGTAVITLSWSSGGDGGSPITRWEYITNTDLAALSTAAGADGTTWTAICDNTDGSAPDCAGTTSVTVPRPPTTPGDATTAPDGALTFVTANALSTAEHHFVVRAQNARGAGFQSGTDSARFTPTVPSAPGAVHIQATSATQITLIWTASVDGGSAITGYEFDVRTGSGSWVRGTDADGDDTNTTAQYTIPASAQDGTPLTFRVRARNANGAGANTESPQTAAGAPPTPGGSAITATGCPGLVATPGTTQVTLALADSAGTACTTGAGTNDNTRWEYSYKVGDGEYGNWAFSNTGAQLSLPDDDSVEAGSQIAGLQNGVPHTFRVRALNGQLSSPILEARSATPGVAPPAPQGLTASAGDQRVTLSWTSGGSGGPPITGWQFCQFVSGTTDCGATAAVGAEGWTAIRGSNADTNSHTIGATPGTELTNGTAYVYMVRAVNVIGVGARAQANSATPGKAPAAPARVIVDSGDGSVTITVDPPAASTDGAVVGYQVRKSMSGGPYDAWEALGSPVRAANAASAHVATVTGLTNGVSYTFQVRAVNAFGPGAEIESAAVTPVGAPEGGELGADPGDGQVALSWASDSSGGSAITKWQYRQSSNGGGYGAWTDIADSGPDTTSHVVTGLDNGTSYTFQVRAVSQVGTGTAITSGAATPGTVPAAPSVSAARGNGQVDLSWTAGTAAGAGATTGWQVRTDDGEWMDVDGADASSYSVTGLMNGTAYTFEVRAVNSFGAGEAGSASATPATTPSAPDVSAERGDGSTAVSWTAGDDGGSAVTGWQVQVNDGGWTDVAADTMSATVDTDDGTAYTIMVRGVNDVGEGAAGSASVEAGSTPAAPTVTATGGNGSITVSWTAGDDGGSSINAWHYRMKVSIGDYGDWMEASADTMSVTLSDLASGTGVLSYTFQVR